MSSADSDDAIDLSHLHDFVAMELRKLDTTFKGPEGQSPRYSGYHEAAAVLSSFEVGALRPNASNPEPGTIASLLSDSIVLRDERERAGRLSGVAAAPAENALSLRRSLSENQPHWTLMPQVRRKVIEQLAGREALLAALESNRRRPEDLLQSMIEMYLRREVPALDAQNVAQLICTGQIVEWFGGVLEYLPKPDEVAGRLEARRLLLPFEKLVGSHFSGREDKLAQLYEYVGVLPTTRWDGVRRSAKEFWNSVAKPPLMIYGPGGVGKSTLVSKFILDHAKLEHIRRFPYTYIDFDRPGLLAEEPLTLLVEAVRQLGVQYPDVREYCDRVRRDWQERLASSARQAETEKSHDAPSATPKLQPEERARFLRDFGALLHAMDAGKEPFLLVLDTFEEVQYRSNEYISLLWDFVTSFQSIVPRLRTVLSGRVLLKGYKTEEMKLEDLDAGAARGFLTSRGVQPPSLVDKIVARVGGSPLSLNLAADVYHKEKKEGDPEAFFEKLKKERIQSQLYTRILDHIQSDDLRQLAHPGLVLRRITPSLILEVLAKPCGLKDKVRNMAQARALFNELIREFTLVVPAEDEALRHMPEVRKGMIELLRDDEQHKEKVKSIQERAVKYYGRLNDPISRAEEIYHRLALGQIGKVVASRWRPGVEPYLQTALEELDPPQQAFLAARLKVTLDESILAEAAQEDWEEIVTRQVEAFFRLGQPEKALEAMSRRRRRRPGSRLHLLKARAFEQAGDLAAALRTVERGIASAEDAPELALDLHLLRARLLSRRGDYQSAWGASARAKELANESNDPARRLEVALLQLGTLERRSRTGQRTEALRREVTTLLSAIPDAQFAENLLLLRAAAGLMPDDARLIQRGVRLVGLEGASPSQLRALARALAEWDLSLGETKGQESGTLARAVNVLLYGTAQDTWLSFMQTARPQHVRAAVAKLLGHFNAPPAVLSALSAIVGLPAEGAGAQGEQTEKVEGESAAASRSGLEASEGGARREQPSVRLTPELRRNLIRGLTNAFPTRASLALMLKFRLELNLDSISLTDKFSEAVYNLITYAERRDILPQLLAAARDANPAEPTLERLARHFGLTAEATGDPDRVDALVESASALSVDRWRTTLTEMEGRICRVELESTGGPTYGTGFLVGPDTLLTCYTVVGPLIEGKLDPAHVVFRFDYKQFSNGTTVSPGTVFRLVQTNWLYDYDLPPGASGNAGLDYALLRLEGLPGTEPVGGEKAEPGAPARGWISFPDLGEAAPTQPTIILHHPRGNALRLTVSTEAASHAVGARDRVGYRFDTEPGSAGAPCFNLNWELIAIHEGRQRAGLFKSSWEGFGVSTQVIRAQVSGRGLGHLLEGARFDTTRLRSGAIFINRMELRRALAALSSSQGPRILVVNGPPGSGKTYTVEFIRDFAYRTPNQHVVYLNLHGKVYVSPEDMLWEVLRLLGPLVPGLPEARNESRVKTVGALLHLLRSVTTRTNLWLVFDDFNPDVPGPVHDLIYRLQLMVAEDARKLRLVLLNYTLPLHPQAVSSSIIENISPFTLEDVHQYLARTFADRPVGEARPAINEVLQHAGALIKQSLDGKRPIHGLNFEIAQLLRVFTG